jgi:peptidoglycan/LPS O-acetylase OafA/YrhL
LKLPVGTPSTTIAGLDGIRGVAILLVLLWHCAVRTNFPPGRMGLLAPVALAGWSGVDLFFGLSGFLITKLIVDEERAAGRFRLRAFYVRRALRILPAYYLVLVANLLVLPAFTIFSSARAAAPARPLEVASLLTYWSNYYYGLTRTNPAPVFGVYWSLCVEEHFYLLWPPLLWRFRSRRTRLAVAVGVCLLLPAMRWVAASTTPASVIHILSHFRVDSIVWGGLAALLFDAAAHRRRERRLVLAVALAAVVAAFTTGQLGVSPTPLGHALGLSALAAMAAALATEVTAAPSAALARLLELRPLRGLGRVSYGMYLLHFQAIDVAAAQVVPVFRYASPASYLTLFLLSAAYAYLAAWVMFRFYERPFLARKERFTPARLPAILQPGL